jgi:hypothetical protein
MPGLMSGTLRLSATERLVRRNELKGDDVSFFFLTFSSFTGTIKPYQSLYSGAFASRYFSSTSFGMCMFAIDQFFRNFFLFG